MRAFGLIFLTTLLVYTAAIVRLLMEYLNPDFIEAVFGAVLLILGFYLMLCKPAGRWISR